MPRPDLTRVPEYYHRYINQAEGDDLNTILKKQSISFFNFLQNIPVSKIDYRYGPDKWSVKEVLQHIIDTERVFTYRALCIARGEQQPLPGFNENEYAENAPCAHREWTEMNEEFKAVRRSTEILIGSLDEKALDRTGISSGKPVYVLGIGFMIPGHVEHHLKILKERYL